MSLNYDEAIVELRAEEERLLKELEQVRAAIPAMVILRNRQRPSLAVSGSFIKRTELKGRLAGMGPTEALPLYLEKAEHPKGNREILEGMKAEGWTTKGQNPQGVISATLVSLQKKGTVEKVGSGWRLKNPAKGISYSHSSEQPQLLPQ